MKFHKTNTRPSFIPCGSTKNLACFRQLSAALAVCAGALQPAFAVEDTNTPGNGHWEINVELNGERNAGGWRFGAPDTDINYGWGDSLQFMVGASHVTVREYGQNSRSGPGIGAAGVKWRFIDQDDAGFSLSTFPQYSWNLASSSARRGIVETGSALYLPLSIGFESEPYGFFAESGRTYIAGKAGDRMVGAKLTYRCMKTVECRVEAERISELGAGHQTLRSVGFKWNLNDLLILKGALGREFGRRTNEQRDLVFQLGLQILQ